MKIQFNFLTRFNLLFPLIWLSCLLFVDPQGEFPLNDDWTFAYPVKSLIEQGKIQYSWPPAVTSIGHIVMGWIFCLGSFSFLNLRIYVLLCSLASFFLLQSFFSKSGRQDCTFSSLVLFFNPIFFCLSYTFMSDIPFFLFSMLAINQGLVNCRRPAKLIPILVFSLFATLATLIRQPAIIIPFAFTIASIFTWKNPLLWSRILTLLPSITCLSIFCVYEFYLKYLLGFPASVNQNVNVIKALQDNIFYTILRLGLVVIKCLIYFGLFTVPILLYYRIFRGLKLKVYLISFILSIIIVGILYLNDKIFPFSGGNIIVNLGLGPVFLADNYEGVLSTSLPPEFWISISFVGAYLGTLLMYKITRFYAFNPFEKDDFFLLIIIVLFIPLTSLIGFFDRYIILPLAPIIFIILKNLIDDSLGNMQKNNMIGVFLLVLISIFSITATKDYLSWNRARWEALAYLENKKISSLSIDGGYEYNGWRNYFKISTIEDTKRWWWVKDDQYIIAFQKLKNYTVIKQIPYRGWMPFKEKKILILEREAIRQNF